MAESDAPAYDTPPDARPLAGLAAPPAPEPWMEAAIAQRPEVLSVEVQGAAIEVLRWGETGKSGLLFIHGGVAHGHWWDHVAPLFTATHSCAALSLSGMGNSGWREDYFHDLYAEEVVAVAQAAGLFDNGAKPMLVGHSFGGLVSVHALTRFGERFSGGVIVDPPVIPLERRLLQERRRDRRHLDYADPAELVSRFRLIPDEPATQPYLLHHVARSGVVQREGGWQWAFDPNVWGKTDPARGHPDFAAVADRIAVIRAEDSKVVGPDSAAALREALGPDTPFVEIPGAGHHVMLNQPLAFVSALRAILACWPPAKGAPA